jgi:hypothetical protein
LDDLFGDAGAGFEGDDEAITTAVDGKLRAIDEGEGAELVAAVIPDAPLPEGARIPTGWQMRAYTDADQYRLLREVVKGTGERRQVTYVDVAHDHCVVVAILTDVDTGRTHLEVAYQAGKNWKHRLIPRGALASGKAIAEALTDYGFPIDASNSRDMVSWLVDFEAANVAILPRRLITAQMGWQGEKGRLGFIIGAEHIRDEGEAEISFQGADIGDQHLATCLGTEGDFEAWCDAVAVLAPFPAAEVALYASLAPPLLKILRAPNFCIEWSGKTSTSKTTAIVAAASCWGNPDINARRSSIASWDMTAVGFERRAAALSGMPLIVDDTKRAKRYRGGDSPIPGIIYEIANGQGRVRGSVTGMAQTRYWRTIMLTTGESRAIDFDKSGGTATRVVSLWGETIPKNDDNADLVTDLTDRLKTNYGHAGRRWICYLRAREADWAGWFAALGEIRHAFRNEIRGSPQRPTDASVIDRLAANLAVLELTEQLAHEALELPWEPTGCVHRIVDKASSGAKVADREAEALGLMASHINGNLDYLEHTTSEKQPPAGWLGWIDSATTDKPWSVIGIHVAVCRKLLAGWGFEPNAILRRWAEDGVTHSDKGRTDKKLTITGGRRIRMIAFRRGPLEGAGFGADATEDLDAVPF